MSEKIGLEKPRVRWSGMDSCIASLTVMKTKAPADADSGVHIKVMLVRFSS